MFWIENVSALPSASEAVGEKLYQTPTSPVVGGVPEIVGAAAKALSGASSTAKNDRDESGDCSHAHGTRARILE